MGIPDPSDKPKSIRITMMRDDCVYVGYYYVLPDDPSPKQSALDACRGRRCNTAWHPSPDYTKAPGTWEDYKR